MENNTFRTEIQIPKATFGITHKDAIMLIGSCFAEKIGEKLTNYKFTTYINPFGILFNPASIAQGLNKIADDFLFEQNDLCFHNNEWISFLHHGKFSDPDAAICLKKVNDALEASRRFLRKASVLILTLGSSIIYKRKGTVVANCHKWSQKEFEREMLSTEDIVAELTEGIQKIRVINPDIRIIFTISPVRTGKDSLPENMLSKAQLIVAVHTLIGNLPDCLYFPSYEIMMDDLRDYRFYDSDMIHPAVEAIQYIWTIFSRTFFDVSTMRINTLIKDILMAKNHRMKYLFSEESKQFVIEQIQRIKQIQNIYPYISFEEELSYFKEININPSV
jgi:hypothetical protein